MSVCIADECERQSAKRQYCHKHYNRLLTTGTTELRARPTASQRFWSRAEKSEGCWEWSAGKTAAGYGSLSVNGKITLAHRYSFELHNGPIPEGAFIDHQCRNRACVRPEHLRLTSHDQNLQNRSGANSNNTSSGVQGVHKSASGRWLARVQCEGYVYRVGSYATIEEAEAAVVAKRLELFTHNDRDRQQQQAS